LTSCADRVPGGDPAVLPALSAAAPGRVWLGATMLRGGCDRRQLQAALVTASAAGVSMAM
jgi:error-prone DNA polymerase